MFKEIKYLFFIIVILAFFFFVGKYYFSDDNKKNSYRSLKLIDKKISKYSQNVVLLKNNTSNIVEYVERTVNKDKKDYNFWKLINNNE